MKMATVLLRIFLFGGVCGYVLMQKDVQDFGEPYKKLPVAGIEPAPPRSADWYVTAYTTGTTPIHGKLPYLRGKGRNPLLLTTSPSHNRHLKKLLIEGDIMLSENEDPWDRQVSLLDMKNKRWPEGIVPYDLNETEYTLLDLYVIREGMKEIEKDTCIRFVPRKDEEDYIFITPNGGCWSYLGRKGFGQTLSLVAPYCMNRGTVIHEFMHALGFWHEHSRPDRDEHIEVLWENIISEEKEANFAKHISGWQDWMDFPYDYMSVMHYSAYAFSKLPTLPTLIPKQTNVRLKALGRAKTVGTLTDIDRMKINTFYECFDSKDESFE